MTPHLTTAIRRDADDGPARRASWLGALAALFVALCGGAAALSVTWDDHSQPLLVVDLALAVLTVSAMWTLRPHVTDRGTRSVAFGLVTGVVAFISSAATGAWLVGLFAATTRGSGRGLTAVLLLAVTLTFTTPLLYPADAGYADGVIVGLLAAAATIGIALTVRGRRQLAAHQHEALAAERRARQLQLDQARAAAHDRIAEETLDTLAHRLAVISLHAGALQYRPDAPPEEITSTVEVIRTTARAALDDVRSTTSPIAG